MPTYTCSICGKQFDSKHVSICCPECKIGTCVVCGKQFKRISPYTQKTCSSKCRGIYRKESGIGKAVGQKMKQTKLEKYGTLDPAAVTIAKNGEISKKKCIFCGKEFTPRTPRQVYCDDKHYGPCPVCGKPTEIKDFTIGPQACSEECRMKRIQSTCLEKYGNIAAVNSEHARKLSKETCLEKYGVEHYSKTDEYHDKIKQTNLDRYGTEWANQNEDVKEKGRQTNREKYGYDYHMQRPEYKEQFKEIMDEKYGGIGLASPELKEKIVATNIERYGVESALSSPEVQAKIRETNLERYGVENGGASEQAAEHRKQTNLDRYGVESVLELEEIQEKIKQTWMDHYGVDNPMKDPDVARRFKEHRDQTMLERYGAVSSVNVPEIKQKISDTMMERYGAPWYVMSDECMEKNYHAIPKPNKEFAKKLNDAGIETEFEYRIERNAYDIYISELNTLVEVDPTFTHNTHWSLWGEPIEPQYHLHKTKLAAEKGMRCIHVFDWDDQDRIVELLAPKSTIYARKCEVKRIDRLTAEAFTKENHLKKSCRGQDICYGLYYEGELIEVMTFGKSRYKKKYDVELLRLCSKRGTKVVGGASKLFKQFTVDYPDKSVLSYCDYAKFSGSVYAEIGMMEITPTTPTRIWSKGNQYITDSYLMSAGYDRIFKTDYGKGTSNVQLMLDNGWLPVYDCGQKAFEYIPGTQDYIWSIR